MTAVDVAAVNARHELLYDTEAALGLVDGEVRAMTGHAAPPPALVRAQDQLHAVIAELRARRAAVGALDGAWGTNVRQAQDAATQQLAFAAGALTDVECRLLAITQLLEASIAAR